ncbi:DUF2759 family protein [Paenibacillus aurantius]|uniref:DUF2759 family protein n=1 Tax=Paenibacillus aurantius TaxID=2918900 RepID=A0AA96LD94_9BACL|nr:DUF2759 family protein [Paenibacillus aurantius]WJH36331.1 DUF2759 family protein [Paenibacillus sp. CC-CFT747]WNQ11632.1 DUF2759 family protein [Paenibacillus aurantius]
MFYWAEDAPAAAAEAASTFDVFDLFIIVFTILIAWGVFRSLTARQKNKFAIGFGIVSLVVFLFMDLIMIQHWMS